MADSISKIQETFKEVYADMPQKAVPSFAIGKKDFPFETKKSEGRSYNLPIIVNRENGFTSSAPFGSGNIASPSLVAINSSRGQTLARATVQGYNTILKGVIAREDIERGQDEWEAVESSLDLFTASLTDSFSHRMEKQYWHGATSLAITSTATRIDDNGPNTSVAIVLSDATWSDGLWAGMEGALITIKGAGVDAKIVKILLVDSITKTLTVSVVDASDVRVDADNDTLFAAFPVAATIYDFDAYNSSMIGVIPQITTQTGSIFNVSKDAWGLWKGNYISNLGAALTRTLLLKNLRYAIGKGLMQDVNCYVPAVTFLELADAEASNRRYDSSYGETAKNGFKNITFTGPNGLVTVKLNAMLKDGQAVVVPTDKVNGVVRLGAQQTRFEPLSGKTEYLRALEGYDAYEARMTCNEAVLVKAPSKALVIEGITH